MKMFTFRKMFIFIMSTVLATFMLTGCFDDDNNKVTLGSKIAYISGPTDPWNDPLYAVAMNTVFGEGGWTRFDMADANSTDPFTNGEYKFVYLEGSDQFGTELQAFMDGNGTFVETFVQKGGVLFVNCAENDVDGVVTLGFDDLNISPQASNEVIAVDENLSIWSGPYTPVVTTYTGTAFGHGTVHSTNLDITPVIIGAPGDGAEGETVLGTFDWGDGYVIVGGMTAVKFHSPNDNNESLNLLMNILSEGSGVQP